MNEPDERRDDDRDETPDWNIPEIEATLGGDGDELSVAARRVLATDRHLSQRRVFYGQAEKDEEESADPADEDNAPR